jgi:hypothetical protein
MPSSIEAGRTGEMSNRIMLRPVTLNEASLIFFSYAFNVLVIDALPCNCYIKDGICCPLM